MSGIQEIKEIPGNGLKYVFRIPGSLSNGKGGAQPSEYLGFRV